MYLYAQKGFGKLFIMLYLIILQYLLTEVVIVLLVRRGSVAILWGNGVKNQHFGTKTPEKYLYGPNYFILFWEITNWAYTKV